MSFCGNKRGNGARGQRGPTANAAFWSLEQRRLAVGLQVNGVSSASQAALLIGTDVRTVFRWKRQHLTGYFDLGDLSSYTEVKDHG